MNRNRSIQKIDAQQNQKNQQSQENQKNQMNQQNQENQQNQAGRFNQVNQNETGIRFVLFVVFIMTVLLGSSIYMKVTPDRMYSASERRMLKKRPKLSKKTVMRGKFQRKYEVYLSEQFPGREHLVTLQTKLSRMLGYKDANGVYFGADDYLLEQYQEQDFDWARIEENVKLTAEFLQEYPNASVMFVPAKSSVLSNKLPMYAELSGEQRFFGLVSDEISDSQRISVNDALNAHNDEYIYYRTDHHWTTHGAYYAYETWAERMGFSAVPKDSYNITDVTDSFFGTTFAKVRTGGRADTISLYERKDGPSYHLDYNMGEFQSDLFYDLDKAESDDPYGVFFGGNQAFVDIRMDKPEKSDDEEKEADSQNGKKSKKGKQNREKTLLIIKDSFGNCFAPLAAGHYDRTYVVDLRHVNIPVSKLLRVYPADDILILYNSIQFMEDDDISKLK